MSFRFSKNHDKNEELQREIEDNFIGRDEINNLSKKASKSSNIPTAKSMDDGGMKTYHDGTDWYLYIKVAGQLLKFKED